MKRCPIDCKQICSNLHNNIENCSISSQTGQWCLKWAPTAHSLTWLVPAQPPLLVWHHALFWASYFIMCSPCELNCHTPHCTSSNQQEFRREVKVWSKGQRGGGMTVQTLMTDRKINTYIQSKTHRDRQSNGPIMKHRLQRQRQGVGILPYHRAQWATGHPVQVQ